MPICAVRLFAKLLNMCMCCAEDIESRSLRDFDPACLASMLKKYLRELPTAIIPEDFYSRFIQESRTMTGKWSSLVCFICILSSLFPLCIALCRLKFSYSRLSRNSFITLVKLVVWALPPPSPLPLASIQCLQTIVRYWILNRQFFNIQRGGCSGKNPLHSCQLKIWGGGRCWNQVATKGETLLFNDPNNNNYIRTCR